MDMLPERLRLPLDGRIDRTPHGWNMRIPVWAEEVTVDKEIVVAEEVVVGIQPVQDVSRVAGTVRREELRIDTEGQLDETRPLRVDEVAAIEDRKSPVDRSPIDR